MHRCHVEPDAWAGDVAVPGPDEIHHLLHVVRAVDGEPVEAFDGAGRVGHGHLSIRGRDVRIAGIAAHVVARPHPELILLQAPPKGKRMDMLVEKATELGVSTILPIATERMIRRTSGQRAGAQVDRWQRIALAASRQSGRAWVPDIRPFASLDEAVAAVSCADRFYVACLRPDSVPWRTVLRGAHAGTPGRLAVLIGPEGDLTDNEMDRAIAAGATAVSLGRRVLRAETAALFALSVLGHEFRD